MGLLMLALTSDEQGGRFTDLIKHRRTVIQNQCLVLTFVDPTITHSVLLAKDKNDEVQL